jgi:hypothetical protein
MWIPKDLPSDLIRPPVYQPIVEHGHLAIGGRNIFMDV